MKIKSIQEKLFALKCVGSLIYREKPFEDVNENNLNPYVVWSSLVHHARDLASKSPVITEKVVYIC